MLKILYFSIVYYKSTTKLLRKYDESTISRSTFVVLLQYFCSSFLRQYYKSTAKVLQKYYESTMFRSTFVVLLQYFRSTFVVLLNTNPCKHKVLASSFAKTHAKVLLWNYCKSTTKLLQKYYGGRSTFVVNYFKSTTATVVLL